MLLKDKFAVISGAATENGMAMQQHVCLLKKAQQSRFLASDLPSFVIGATIDVDGGISIRP